MKAFRTRVKVEYEGEDITNDISQYLLDFNYRDTENVSEDIEINLENRDALWMRDWFPSRGDKIKPTIEIIDEEGNVEELPCGRFEIDDLSAKGPPDRVSIKGISVLLSNEAKDTKKSQAWEKLTYKKIATEIASRNGYEAIFNIEDKNDKEYDKLDQNSESDIEFLLRISDELNFGVKIEDVQIIISDEEYYEKMDPIITIYFQDMEERKKGIEKNVGFVLKSYDLKQSALTSYSSCELNYKDPKSGELISVTVENEKEQVTGKVLRLNQKVKSEKEAEDICRKALEKQNKETNPARFSIAPRIPLSAKSIVEIKDFGVFDGRYLVNSVGHNISSSGYSVELDCVKFIKGEGLLKSSSNSTEKEKSVSQAEGVEKMIEFAESNLGKTYSQKNRMSANSFDCSSLVSRSMSAAGLAPDGAAWSTRTLPTSGYLVEIPMSEIQRGDVLNSYDNHAMIYLGDNRVIESQPGKGVTYNPLRTAGYKAYRVKGVT